MTPLMSVLALMFVDKAGSSQVYAISLAAFCSLFFSCAYQSLGKGVWWAPVVPATREAELGGSLATKSLRSAQAEKKKKDYSYEQAKTL
jgi:hypothetical protein